jgi:hypothetical protein
MKIEIRKNEELNRMTFIVNPEDHDSFMAVEGSVSVDLLEKAIPHYRHIYIVSFMENNPSMLTKIIVHNPNSISSQTFSVEDGFFHDWPWNLCVKLQADPLVEVVEA